MLSFSSNKFKTLSENRFGRLPTPDKLCFDIAKGDSLCYLAPVPTWETMGITAQEHYEKYYKNPNTIKCVPEMDISGSWECVADEVCDFKESKHNTVLVASSQIDDIITPTAIDGTDT